MDKMNLKKCKNGNKGITLIALVITIIVLLILAGITINALTGSDSAPAKANEAGQKNDIGLAKDQITLTAVNAKTEAYDAAYVRNEIPSTAAADSVGRAVIKAVAEQINTKNQYGKATVEVTGYGTLDNITNNAKITITTRDFKEYGLIELSDGTLKWITPVPITTIGTITASNTAVKERKTITLTAPINNDATESLIWTSSDDNVATVTSTGKNTAKVKGLTGQAGNSVTITARYGDLTPVTIEISVIENNVESFVGKYADLDGDGTPDGIIFADFLAQDPTEKWANDDGTYTLPTITDEDNVKEYEISGNTTDTRFEKTGIAFTSYTSRDVVKLSSTSTGTEKRFYVMKLEDYNKNYTYQWNTAKDITETTTVGTLTYNWICPSKEQWSMFGSAFSISNISTDPHYYQNYGLSNYYWSSTEFFAWDLYASGADYINGRMYLNKKTYNGYVRLCTTF